MVIFLVGLVSMILMRTLRKDYARYSKEEDGDDMVIFTFVTLYRLLLLIVAVKVQDLEFLPIFEDVSKPSNHHDNFFIRHLTCCRKYRQNH